MMTASVTVDCDADAGEDFCEAEFHIDGIPGEEFHAIVQRTFRQAGQRGWSRSYDGRGRPRFRCPLHAQPARARYGEVARAEAGKEADRG